MATRSVTKATAFHQHKGLDVFQVAEAMPAEGALAFADVALEVAKSLLTEIVAENGEDAADKAWAARFLVEAAIGCYESVGARP